MKKKINTKEQFTWISCIVILCFVVVVLFPLSCPPDVGYWSLFFAVFSIAVYFHSIFLLSVVTMFVLSSKVFVLNAEAVMLTYVQLILLFFNVCVWEMREKGGGGVTRGQNAHLKDFLMWVWSSIRLGFTSIRSEIKNPWLYTVQQLLW